MGTARKGQKRGRATSESTSVEPIDQQESVEQDRDKDKFRRAPSLGKLAAIIPGGRKSIIEYARLAAEYNPDVASMVEYWDHGREKHKTGLSIEKACYKANLSMRDLFTSITAVMYEVNVENFGNMIAALAHPEVVKQSIRQAQKPSGYKDREMLFKHAGFLPLPKGSTININTALLSRVNTGASEANEEKGLPAFEATTGAVVSAVRGDEES